jgi:hypothetical protein
MSLTHNSTEELSKMKVLTTEEFETYLSKELFHEMQIMYYAARESERLRDVGGLKLSSEKQIQYLGMNVTFTIAFEIKK